MTGWVLNHQPHHSSGGVNLWLYGNRFVRPREQTALSLQMSANI